MTTQTSHPQPPHTTNPNVIGASVALALMYLLLIITMMLLWQKADGEF